MGSEMEGPVRILHVDDEPEFLELAAEFLEREDERFEVETATDAEAGLRRLAEAAFDCVVSDYDMPGTDGIEFLEAVRADHPDLPFVLFTGKGSEAVASDAVSAGVTDYLQKRGGTSQYAVLANRVGNAVAAYRTERELRESERRFRTMAEVSPDTIFRLDPAGEFVYVSPAVETLLGYRPDAMVGTHFREYVVEESVSDAVDGYARVLDGEVVKGLELGLTDADGETVEVELNASPVVEGGEVAYVQGFARDVTDRRERERRLERTTARLEALFEGSPDMINVHDEDGTIVDPNPRLCEATGYDADELAGTKVWEIDQAIEPEEARSLWAEMSVGDRRELEGRFRRADGSTFPVEVHVRRLDLAGEGRFVAISRDVTEREERERGLRRYERMVNTMQEAACIYDEEGRFLLVNEYLAEFYGTTPAALEGERSKLLPKVRASAAGDPVGELLDGERDEVHGEVAGEFEGHGREVLEYRLVPMEIEGSIEGIVGTAHEVTDRERRERELVETNQRLEEFAGIVSHDLRGPLNVAEGRLELAREAAEREAVADHAGEAGEALARMRALIEDLLALARDGDAAGELEPVGLGSLLADCWQDVDAETATLEADADRRVLADEGRLRQLLANLLRNAVEHGGEDVTVTAGTLDGEAGFYVADDGPGIPAADREAALEAGYSTAEDGTGYGLAIVERVADAHGWELRVTDAADGGARIEVAGVEFADR